VTLSELLHDAMPYLAGAGGTGGLVALYRYWTHHAREVRKESDTVALDLVRTLTDRVDKLETENKAQAVLMDAERRACAGEVSALEHQVRNVQSEFDMLVALIERDPDRAADALATIKRLREERSLRRVGADRQTAQKKLSTARVMGDASRGV
jgi:hypothetical protein